MWIKYSTAKQAVNENIIQRMPFSCRIIKTKIETYAEYFIFNVFAR